MQSGFHLATRRHIGDRQSAEYPRARPSPRRAPGTAIATAASLALFAVLACNAASANLLAPIELHAFDSRFQAEDREGTKSFPSIAGLGLGCGAADVFGMDAAPEPTAFSACVEVDWLPGDALTPIDTSRTKYGVSPFNREVARLLKHMSAVRGEANLEPASDGMDPESADPASIEAAIIDAFKLGGQGPKNPVDQIDDSLDRLPVGDASYSADALNPHAGGSPESKPVTAASGTLPEPFNTLLSIGSNLTATVKDAGHFLQENRWMSICIVLAFLPVGLAQIARRRRRFR